MIFRNPVFLYLLLLLPLLIFFYALAFRWKRAMLKKFGDDALVQKLSTMTSAGRQATKAALVLAAFIFMVAALARPMWGTNVEMMHRKGLDIVIALDLSTSMLAEDIQPSRIRRAKYEIGKLVDKLAGDRVALVGFAGSAFVQCPMTTDYAALKMFLDVLDPSIIETQGTAMGNAIDRARLCFTPGDTKYKVIVLITDGEDNEGDPGAEAQKAAGEGVIIYTLGVGTKGGVPIPMAQGQGNVVYKKNREGNPVLTSINEEALEEIASVTGGKYFHSTGSGLELDRIYGEINKMDKKELAARQFGRYKEQFMWPLSLALFLLAAEFFVSSRRKRKRTWDGRFE